MKNPAVSMSEVPALGQGRFSGGRRGARGGGGSRGEAARRAARGARATPEAQVAQGRTPARRGGRVISEVVRKMACELVKAFQTNGLDAGRGLGQHAWAMSQQRHRNKISDLGCWALALWVGIYE